MKHLSTIPKKVSLLPMKQGIAETLIMTQDYESPSSPSTMKQSTDSKQKETAFVDIQPEKYTTPPILPDWCFLNLGSFTIQPLFSMPFGAGYEQTYLGGEPKSFPTSTRKLESRHGSSLSPSTSRGKHPKCIFFADSYQHSSPFQQAEAVYPNQHESSL